ncbi:MAG: T9SS type A sorting domain-containing protein [Aliifodinibius sp.]|nr:T9SS type A sorting domain-containing protein [Fodinibius sp.]
MYFLFTILILANTALLFTQQSVQIVSVFPSQSTLHVPRNTEITAEFNSQIDAMTVNSKTVIVRGEDSGPHAGLITYDSTTKAITFKSVKGFFAGELVTVTLTDRIQSAQGEPLKGFTWQFTVEAPQPTPPFFREGNDLLIGQPVIAIYTADLDGDEALDIVASQHFTSEPIVVLRNDGDGVFSQRDNYSLRGEANSIFGNDFDNDGDIDLVTNTALSAARIAVLLNDGSGQFPDILRFNNTSLQSLPITTVRDGDIDNDGDVDLIYATARDDSGNGWIGILENDGNAEFIDARQIKLRNLPVYLYLADLNNDGWLDIITGMAFTVGQAEFWNGMGILLNNGDGSFAEAEYYTYFLATETMYRNDFDADGDMDIAVAINPEGLLIYLNDGEGAFPDSVDLRGRDSIFQVWGSDFDGDGDIDLLETQNPRFPNTPAVRLYLNPGDGRFSFSEVKDLKVVSDISMRGYGRPPNGGDLDNDGDMDLVVPFDSSGSWLSFFFNQTDPVSVDATAPNFPKEFALEQNYPNPFNAETRIAYYLRSPGLVKLTVYNLQGKEVITLMDKRVETGRYELEWNGKNMRGNEVGSGIYFYKLEVFSQDYHSRKRVFEQTRKMLFLK